MGQIPKDTAPAYPSCRKGKLAKTRAKPLVLERLENAVFAG
jgi:hypothetical protein